jgi:hypothetical protein
MRTHFSLTLPTIIVCLLLQTKHDLNETTWKLLRIEDDKKNLIYSFRNDEIEKTPTAFISFKDSSFHAFVVNSIITKCRVTSDSVIFGKESMSTLVNCFPKQRELENLIGHISNCSYRVKQDTLFLNDSKSNLFFTFIKK